MTAPATRRLCSFLLVLSCLVLLISPVHSAFDLYCGDQTCYDVLELNKNGGVGRASSPSQVKKAFYRLSLLHHPDKASPSASPQDQQQRADRYQEIVTAYEVLSNPTSRESYNSFLDNPHLFSHHLRYYQHRVRSAQISPWKVLGSLLLLLTLFHHLYIHHRYGAVRRQLAAHPTVQSKLLIKVKRDMMDEMGRVDQSQISARIRREEERIEQHVSIMGSEGEKPTWRRVLPLELIRWGVKVGKGVGWGVKWVVWHGWMAKEYGEEEREWATARALKMSWDKWRDVVPEDERHQLVKRELWHKRNWDEFVLEKKKEAAGQKRKYR